MSVEARFGDGTIIPGALRLSLRLRRTEELRVTDGRDPMLARTSQQCCLQALETANLRGPKCAVIQGGSRPTSSRVDSVGAALHAEDHQESSVATQVPPALWVTLSFISITVRCQPDGLCS